jgi:hypothetical protein
MAHITQQILKHLHERKAERHYSTTADSSIITACTPDDGQLDRNMRWYAINRRRVSINPKLHTDGKKWNTKSDFQIIMHQYLTTWCHIFSILKGSSNDMQKDMQMLTHRIRPFNTSGCYPHTGMSFASINWYGTCMIRRESHEFTLWIYRIISW